MKPIAALYVMSDGPYAGLDGVEVWDEERDARTYPGPHQRGTLRRRLIRYAILAAFTPGILAICLYSGGRGSPPD